MQRWLMCVLMLGICSSVHAYDYDVSGSDQSGESVNGSVSVDHSGGDGTITDADGEERHIDVEWTGHGQLEGTDEDGNTYELETE